ncbi:MAG: hypothetical protein V8S38_11865 [Lachnospiraceae bacterium]
MFKKFKKFAAVLLAFTMLMGLAMTASAATIVSNTQDASVMTMSSTNGTVSYNATKVEGDARKPDIRMSPDTPITVMLPKGGSLSSNEKKRQNRCDSDDCSGAGFSSSHKSVRVKNRSILEIESSKRSKR